jgi:lysozyme family protein
MNDEQIFDDILEREGGWVDRPDDAGGPTNRGVTLKTLRSIRGAQVSIADLRALTERDAREIYREHYLQRPGFGNVQDGPLRALLVDSAVHSGPSNAVRFLQRALRIEDDGVLGPKTVAALWDQNARHLFWLVMAERMEFLARLVSKDLTDRDRDGIPDAAENALGWFRRLGGLIREVA